MKIHLFSDLYDPISSMGHISSDSNENEGGMQALAISAYDAYEEEKLAGHIYFAMTI